MPDTDLKSELLPGRDDRILLVGVAWHEGVVDTLVEQNGETFTVGEVRLFRVVQPIEHFFDQQRMPAAVRFSVCLLRAGIWLTAWMAPGFALDLLTPADIFAIPARARAE